VNEAGERLDYDWIVVGSGFGGSVAALRLGEKGYRVAVLECGRRYLDEDFAESTWNFRRYYWMPKIGLRGIFRMTLFEDVFIVSGSGVGGGSLGYANTLYRARPAFFRDPQWDSLGDWESALDPHYDTAERMLGVTDYPLEGPADLLLKEYGEQIGVGDTFKHTRVGAFFGEPGKEVPDPYFGGDGPAGEGNRARDLHGRLPLQRQEHLGQELPLVRRAARGRDPPRAAGHGREIDLRGRRRRLRRLRGDERALRLMGAEARFDADRARCRDRRRCARDKQAARGVQ
jgi:choline dehydrogenase-like flavoprotein